MKNALFLALFLVLLVPTAVGAAEAEGDEQTTYRMPPGPLAEIVDAPPTPIVGLSLDRKWMVLMDYPSLLSIDELAEPELRLAGLRIRPRTNGPSRDFSLSALTLNLGGQAVTVVGDAQGPRVPVPTTFESERTVTVQPVAAASGPAEPARP